MLASIAFKPFKVLVDHTGKDSIEDWCNLGHLEVEEL
jgi:hypothetical protein